MNLFFRRLLIFSVLVVIVMTGLSYLLLTNGKAGYQHSYQHQLYLHHLNKIKHKDPITTLFIGGSALGYSIDSKVFSELSLQPSLNCALTGLYGYAGPYNILKRVHKYHPEVENIVIMNTLDMQMRGISFDGYFRTINSISDITELSNSNIFELLRGMLRYIKTIPANNMESSKNRIQNDYILQGPKVVFIDLPKPYDTNKINRNKNYFLNKIHNYCSINQLNLVYVHGPIYDKRASVSLSYIAFINKSISELGIEVIPNIISVKNKELGNSEDHVSPELKRKYTLIYYELLEKHLK